MRFFNIHFDSTLNGITIFSFDNALQLSTVKPTLCDSSREEENKVTLDRMSLNTGSIYMNIIALGYENYGLLIQEGGC